MSVFQKLRGGTVLKNKGNVCFRDVRNGSIHGQGTLDALKPGPLDLGQWLYLQGVGDVEERAGLEGTSSYPTSSVGLLGPREPRLTADWAGDTGVLLCFLRSFYGENVKQHAVHRSF